ncbi:MAG: hypothetical protein NWQ82_03330 [Solirubrobacteraceae bacterium]|jgi:hypothetical protein|nr:hypothetical protein [Solirubrobacteraceae bacterium]MDP4673550.1 hypothetical protein [Solirubrobacteraceae bacterium]MDP4920982.1 hypothetical protein [Solirubrobacteraceae bacterium]
MLKKFAVVIAAGVATVALAACGGYDPTDAVNNFNKEVNSQIQSSLSSAGITASVATDAGVDLKCPSDVEKETPFTCTVTGKLSEKTVDVQMEVNSSDELAPANNSAFSAALNTLSTAEGTAVGKAATK